MRTWHGTVVGEWKQSEGKEIYISVHPTTQREKTHRIINNTMRNVNANNDPFKFNLQIYLRLFKSLLKIFILIRSHIFWDVISTRNKPCLLACYDAKLMEEWEKKRDRKMKRQKIYFTPSFSPQDYLWSFVWKKDLQLDEKGNPSCEELWILRGPPPTTTTSEHTTEQRTNEADKKGFMKFHFSVDWAVVWRGLTEDRQEWWEYERSIFWEFESAYISESISCAQVFDLLPLLRLVRSLSLSSSPLWHALVQREHGIYLQVYIKQFHH